MSPLSPWALEFYIFRARLSHASALPLALLAGLLGFGRLLHPTPGIDQGAALWGLRTHQPGRAYHDGRLVHLEVVVEHYDDHFQLGLSTSEKADLIAYVRAI